APLIDAAWRDRPQILDGCLDVAASAAAAGPTPARATVRFAIEIEIDARGAVTHAVAKAPPPLDGAFARCAEAAVRDGLRVPPPGRGRPTHARMELVVASGEAGGL